MSGTLYVVATPIGNLEDLTHRAERVLSEVAMIACEDTRVTAKLLAHLGLKKTMVALHQHSGSGHFKRLLDALSQGEDVAYVCDAGTPGVNDPGGKLVEVCVGAGIRAVPIPGASALTTAISVCGFPMDDFTYVGFVPHKKGRETLFREMAERKTATVFLESTHRIEKTLEQLSKTLQEGRQLFVGRELTKLHETLYRGTVDEVLKAIQSTSSKGEFLVIVAPA